MTLSMEQFREQLVDYLYGQLEGDALRAFEACLEESADCRSELAALEHTLARARAGLLASTYEEPPPRVRSAVLAAAAAHVLAERSTADEPARVVSLDERRARASKAGSRTADREGKGRVLRAPWLVSTLGVAAAVALLVMGKNIESPRSERDEHASKAAPGVTQSPSAPTPPSLAAAPAPADESAAPEQARKKRGESQLELPRAEPHAAAKPAPSRARAPSQGFAEPPASWSREVQAEKRATRHAAPADGYAEAQRDDRSVEREQAPAEDKAASAPRGAAPMAAQPASEAASTGGAGAALGRSYGAAEPAAAAAAPVRRAEESADSSASRLSNSEQTLSHDELLHRARQQVAARSWAQAVESYRELLRRFPADKQAASWRKQLAWALAQQGRDSAR